MIKTIGISALILSVIGAAFFFVIKTSNDRSIAQAKEIREAAYQEGLKKGQLDTVVASAENLTNEIRRVANLQAETNQKISNIRASAHTTREIIREYPIDTVAITRPEEVEVWANKTTSDLFSEIAAESQK